MFKKSVVVMLLLAVVGLLVACGPVGPAGPTGRAGPTGPAGPPGKEAVLSTATLAITPVSAIATTPIKISGAGFQPGEKVEAWMMLGGVRCGLGGYGQPGDTKTAVNQDGTFVISSQIPNSNVCLPGVYAVNVAGDKGSVAVYPLEVIAAKK